MKSLIVIYILIGFVSMLVPQIAPDLQDLGLPTALIHILSVASAGLVLTVGTIALAFGVKELPALPFGTKPTPPTIDVAKE